MTSRQGVKGLFGTVFRQTEVDRKVVYSLSLPREEAASPSETSQMGAALGWTVSGWKVPAADPGVLSFIPRTVGSRGSPK